MGKNRKQLKNGVDQVQNCCVIETENPNQEVPEDFLTSDNFCVVQKKKNNKKFLESPDFDVHFQAQTNFGKSSDEDATGKCHTSFWTCKFNGSLTGDSVPNESEFPSSEDKHEDTVAESSEFHAESEPDNTPLNPNFETCLPSDGKVSELETSLPSDGKVSELETSLPETSLPSDENLSESVKPENSTSVIVNNDNFEIKPFNESVANENVCCTKKKNKKKDHRKNPVDEEVEKLLKELEASDKSAIKHKNSTAIQASSSCRKSSRRLSCDNVNTGVNNSSSVRKEKASGLASHESKSESSVNVHKPNNPSFEETAKGKSGLVTKDPNHVAKTSDKKKEKNTKLKQKVTESDNLQKSDLSEIACVDIAMVDERNVENSSSSGMEEKTQKSQNRESDKRGKRPSKKQLALIHEALKKAKEEEERLKKEEEMKQKMAEEAERIRQEKLRQEQEKKDKKKLKVKQRREKMRAEGRLLSKSQKQSRARMEATLAAFRQQGIDVPQISDKKPFSHGPRLGSCKIHRKRYDSSQSTQSCDSAIVISERQKSESFSSQESGKDNLVDLPSSFDSTDESAVTPESDKGIFSYSEESDGLDENIPCDKPNKEVTDSLALTEKPKKSKAEKLSENEVKLLESNHKMNEVKYRSPVVCVLGHVDTGKTKLLDYIRKTHVQDSEAGGITQQIGATMIPQDALKEKCKMVKDFSSFKMKIPGLLVIDTPGHESFSNLRSRGSSICDIAVLVVDIMHGLEPQTIESINLLKKGKTPFIVALNKVDRIYGWKSAKDEDIENTIKNQSPTTQMEFKRRCQEIILQFANLCLNATLIYENKDPRSYISMVPTSAISGDGMGNVLSSIVHLTQSLMNKRIIYSSELEATVLEVKAIPGLGTTVDVILVNGRLQEGDTIVLAGQEGPIVTQIRSLLMPQPLKELRVKNPYIEYKAIEGAQGIKITGRDLEKSIAGLPLLVASNHNTAEVLKDELNRLFRDTINSIKTSERGVYVQASTLGSLEALLDFLSASGIPYFNVKIGPVVKKDVIKASIMLEHDIMYAAILAFDVKIERDAQEIADGLGVHIFHADIIYHLFDMYINFRDDLLLKRQEEIKRLAVFPCKLRILPDFIFSPRDPIVLGVHVEQGSLRVGTPLCVPSKDILEIGVVSSIEMNNNKISCAKKGDEVCIKIDPKPGEIPKTFGKHFSCEDLIVSRISRQSIDTCKEHFRNELQSCDWHLIVELKKMLHIV